MIWVEVVESVTEAYTSSDHARPKSPCGGLLQREGLPGSSARDSIEELQTLMPGFVSSKTATFCSEQLCNVTDYLETILVASLDWGRVSGSDIFRPMTNETRTT